jgi:hypothetical protein
MARKLKVFRTAIGFHDAYVAAPSRKAALAAWGADADLFARGVAEEVTDAKLIKAPLARPGEVIRVSRGDLTEHLKALPKRRQRKTAPSSVSKPRSPTPPPKRDRVERAEKDLAALMERHQADIAKLEDALETLLARQMKERLAFERKRDSAREAYRVALDRWSS